MKKFNWALGLLTVGILLIISDIILQFNKPSAKKVAVGMGLTGTGLIVIAVIMLFSVKPQLKLQS